MQVQGEYEEVAQTCFCNTTTACWVTPGRVKCRKVVGFTCAYVAPGVRQQQVQAELVPGTH